MKIFILLLVILPLASCDVKCTKLPDRLRNCLTTRDSNFQLSDEQVSTTCLLEYLWENRKRCNNVSKATYKWLLSLVNKPSSSILPKKAKEYVSNSTNSNSTADTSGSYSSRENVSSASAESFANASYTQNHTRVGRSTPKGPRQRREYRTLTEEERNTYHRAINKLKEDTSVPPNKYDALAQYHSNTQDSAHGGVAFAGWHRYYLVLYERALQEKEPSVMLPYLDTTLDIEMTDPSDSVIFTDKFLGNPHGQVTTGPFGHWKDKIERSVQKTTQLRVKREDIEQFIKESSDQGEFVRVLENAHNTPHVWVGGGMLDLDRAPFDPIFYMHHAFVDCVWELYREHAKSNGENPEKYPPTDNDLHVGNRSMVNLPPLNGVSLTNSDGYKNSWTQVYYTCAPLPSCSDSHRNCGSDWLECDIFSSKCVSKGSAAALPSVTDKDIIKVKNILSDKTVVSNASKPSATKVTGEEFFKVIKEIKSATDNQTKPSVSVPIKQKQKPVLKIPDFVKSCTGKPVENNFRVDCCEGTTEWSFLPIKVINLRHGDVTYSSHPVTKNKGKDYSSDLYSLGSQLEFTANVNEKFRAKKQTCKHDDSGLMKIQISSYGLNYNGIYRDVVYVDNRRSVSTEISYIGVKNPGKNVTEVFVTATDECGIACQPMILSDNNHSKNAHCKYKHIKGAFKITSDRPKYHCGTPRGAEAMVWSANRTNIPVANDERIPLVFYCDYRRSNPWCKSQE